MSEPPEDLSDPQAPDGPLSVEGTESPARKPRKYTWIRKRPPGDVIDRSRYRAEIEELLLCGWTPRNLNAFLAKQHADYEPVSEAMLQWHRRVKLRGRQRDVPKYEKILEDDRVLIDTIRMKAGLLLFQQRRLDRAIELEETMPGVVLDQVGREMERLVKLAESYEQSLQLLGVLPRDPGTVVPGALNLTQQNVTVLVAKQVDEEVGRLVERIPEELRVPLGYALEAARLAKSAGRLKEIEAQVRSRAPAPIDLDSPAQRPSK